MEFYNTEEALHQAFETFVENIPFYGFAVLCIDHPVVQSLIGQIEDRRILTYGVSSQADVRLVGLAVEDGQSQFDVVITKRLSGEEMRLESMRIPMLGKHNVLNTLAAIAVADEMGISEATIRRGLAGFGGVKRRFTRTGEVAGITVIDDYGHHPVEISAVLEAARQATAGQVIAVVQPHRYSRLAALFRDFCSCFNEADVVVVADVYPAGEEPIEGADRDHLIEGLRAHGHRKVLALEGPEALASLIAKTAHEGDMVVCLGAGSISAWANALPKELAALLEGSGTKSAGAGS